MPSPKSGQPCNLVMPVAPREAVDADNANPGEAAKLKADPQQSSAGNYGSTPVKSFKRKNAEGDQAEDDPEKEKGKAWIEIVLVDEENQPVSGQAYKITLPDGSVESGTLDENGLARVDGVDPGTCNVTFPDLDKDAWGKA
jgi:type VI secretion system secreted protein VgrG